jgi:anti-sigma factor RsiW
VADHLVGGLHCEDASDLAASFVLGALEPAEADAVRAHLAGCPEAHAEFAELGSVVPALFETVDVVAPPSALRDRILAAAAADAPASGQVPHQGPRPDISVPPASIPARSPGGLGIFRRPIWAAVALAAALAVVALGAWNLQLRDQIDGLTAYRDGVAALLDQASQPGAQLAVLSNGAAPGPNGLAVVAKGGIAVSLVMRDLAPTSGTEVYEAWLIAGENAPVPIGSFTVNATGIAAFTANAVAPGDLPSLTVALTREPGPGATTPTLPIIAAGATS